MTLYRVWNANYDYCCFVFDTSRNRAKARCASRFGEEYIDMRCETLKHGVNVPFPLIVDCPEDEGYDMVLACGYHYATEEEMCEEIDKWLNEPFFKEG